MMGAGRAGYNPDRRRTLVERYRAARRDPSLVVIEGLHALRHALRFGAEPIEVLTSDPADTDRLARELAPDVADRIRALARPIDGDTLAQLTPAPIHTGVIALAPRPAQDLRAALDDPRPAPVIFLEAPANAYNLGAIVRIAAAADAAALLATGKHDPWNPGSVRAGAGLQFALPVARVDALPTSDRPLVALDPDGDEVAPDAIPPRAVLAFGTERYGLSDETVRAAALRIRIPMRDGVSSLNLATSVAAVVYAMRWGRSPS
ncbi:MAG TPA: TrmH family RNA methyltransferase [Longimicrobiales bacterium]